MHHSDSKIVEHFTERSSNYNIGENWVTNSSVLDAIKTLLPDEELKIVDLGAGTCVVSNYILENHDKYLVYAVDLNKDMLKKCSNENIIRVVSDIEKMPFNDCFFDAAVSRQCLHYINRVDSALKEIKRIIIPKGMFIFAQIIPYDTETHNYWSSIIKVRQPLRKQYFDKQMWIRKIEENGFRLIESSEIVTRSTLNDWIYKYNIHDQDRISLMKDLLKNAPPDYKEKYNIECIDNDITYNSNWLIAKFVSI